MEIELSDDKLRTLVKFQEQIGKLNLEEMLEFVTKEIVETLGIERCSIFRIGLNTEKVSLVFGEPRNGHGLGMCFSLGKLGALKEAVKTKRYLIISDPKNDGRTAESRAIIFDKNINAILFVPLIARERVIGVIVVDANNDKESFTQEEIRFCLNVGNLVSLLLERDSLLKEQTEREYLAILGQAALEVADRIRNPLVSIGGYARSLEKRLEDPQLKAQARIIVDQTKVLETFVDKLLKVPRNRSRNPIEININDVLKRIKDSLLESAKNKNIRIDLQLAPDLPTILADLSEINDVFFAILKNAVDAISETGEIIVGTKEEQGQIEVSITNDGGCIDDEVMKQIFNPFFTTKIDGTGLGLAIAMAIVRTYGGKINVENDPALGLATFVVKIPLSKNKLTDLK